MADDKILKPKSFRIDDKTADKFKEIAASINGNQQETLSKLIEAYEFQSGKAILTERKADIEQFENYVTVLTRMYMRSLEDNQNITKTVEAEFEGDLQSKDTLIKDLQDKLAVAKQVEQDATSRAKSYADENKDLADTIAKMQQEHTQKITDMQQMLTDKENLNKALTDSCNDLKAKIDQMTAAVQENEALKKDVSDLIADKNRLMKNVEDHEKTISDLKQHEADALERQMQQSNLEKEKAVLELERKYQQQIQELKEQKQQEVDKYQQKYFNLLEKLQNEQ
jgi:chromosome segregation ATPase